MFEKCQGAWRPRSRASHGHIYSVPGIIIRFLLASPAHTSPRLLASCLATPITVSRGQTITRRSYPPSLCHCVPLCGSAGVRTGRAPAVYWARAQVAPSLGCTPHSAPPPAPRPPGHGDGDSDAGMTEDSSYNGEIINYYILQIYDDLGLRIVDS